MIQIAAVDDELHALERFERIALEIKELKICGLFETGEELLNYLKKEPLDVVFLDIEMPDVDGLQLSEQILDLHENIDIVFVTAFNQYAVEAFELQALDYIMKPLTEERLGKTVRKLLKNKKIVAPIGKPFIQCLGDFEIFKNGQALTWKNSKAKEVLAFLVHKEGVPVNWEKVANAVWPDYNAEKAQTNFHATTYLLRKKLAEAGLTHILDSGRGNYRIMTEQIDCDLYQLEKLMNTKQMRREEDIRLLFQLDQRGYMEESGYAWAFPRAAELEQQCKRFLKDLKNKK